MQKCKDIKAYTTVSTKTTPPPKTPAPPPQRRNSYEAEHATSTMPFTERPIDREASDAMHGFMGRFMEKFTTSLPVSPVFILTKFSTAVSRCLDAFGEKVGFFNMFTDLQISRHVKLR